jgi:putative intracellular protease/amidase
VHKDLIEREEMGDAGSSPSPPPSSSAMARSLVVAIPLYERFTALDAIGPYELLHVIPGVRVVFLGRESGELLSADNGMLKLSATASFQDVTRPDIVIVPGGPGCFAAAKDPAFVAWIKQVTS